MATARPIFRIFDYDKAVEFYVNWLGFTVDWENRIENAPIYLQISLGGVVIHLSEHYGDCTPGSAVFIEDFKGLKEYHKLLVSKNYKYYNPGLERASWSIKALSMKVSDPFGNSLTFTYPGIG